jgi:putative FmdB family regulatory protein
VPLYEYSCTACGRFEVLQKLSDSPLKACPTCGGEIHRLLSAPAIQFKGTGWYVTDYARKSSSGSAKQSGEAGSPKGSSESTPKTTTSNEGSATGSSPTK